MVLLPPPTLLLQLPLLRLLNNSVRLDGRRDGPQQSEQPKATNRNASCSRHHASQAKSECSRFPLTEYHHPTSGCLPHPYYYSYYYGQPVWTCRSAVVSLVRERARPCPRLPVSHCRPRRSGKGRGHGILLWRRFKKSIVVSMVAAGTTRRECLLEEGISSGRL